MQQEQNQQHQEISRIAPILRKRAEEMGWDLYDISAQIRCTYEYARRLLAGLSIPSDGKMMDIMEGFRFDETTAVELDRLVQEDRLAHDRRRREVRSEKYPNHPKNKVRARGEDGSGSEG